MSHICAAGLHEGKGLLCIDDDDNDSDDEELVALRGLEAAVGARVTAAGGFHLRNWMAYCFNTTSNS
jgi:hypothetical protein